MSDYPREIESLGDVDGARPDGAVVRLSGSDEIDRALLAGGRIMLTVVGEVTGISFRQVNGALIRYHTVKVELVGEARGELAEAVADYMGAVEDRRQGRAALPLDDGGS